MRPETQLLIDLMERRGWNQLQAAPMLGISQSTMSRLLDESIQMHGSTKILIEVQMIEAQIEELTMGDYDTRIELLRRRNELLGGNRNAFDEDLLKNYYEPIRETLLRHGL